MKNAESAFRSSHPTMSSGLFFRCWMACTDLISSGMKSTIATLRGTPQDPVDWSSPDDWIPERLGGTDRQTAEAVWKGTNKQVNPRHVTGHWLLARNYSLLDESADGTLHLSDRGKDFVENPEGEAATAIDEGEGLLKLLALVADNGPASSGELAEAWGDYLARYSKFGTDSTIKDTLRRRLRNLLDRGMLERSGTKYSISDAGLAYLRRSGMETLRSERSCKRFASLSASRRPP